MATHGGGTTDWSRIMILSVFLFSSPVASYCAFALGHDKVLCAVANTYGFSSAMIALYLYPFFSAQSLARRVNLATINWLLWLTCFTEVVFQIPHNIFVKQLHYAKGTIAEWPFYAYGLCDSRWDSYHDGAGLAPEVWLINWNDAVLGVAVLFAFLHDKRQHGSASSTILLVLAVIFRDATLWRGNYVCDFFCAHSPLLSL